MLNLILTTEGDELSSLKSMTDSKGSIHGFHKLIFVDCGNSTRRTIIKHIS